MGQESIAILRVPVYFGALKSSERFVTPKINLSCKLLLPVCIIHFILITKVHI